MERPPAPSMPATGSPSSATTGAADASSPARPRGERTTATWLPPAVSPVPISRGRSNNGTISPRRLNTPKTAGDAPGTRVTGGTAITRSTVSTASAYESCPTSRSSTRTLSPHLAIARQRRGRAGGGLVERHGERGEPRGGVRDLLGGGGDLAARGGQLFHRLDDLRGGRALLLGGHADLRGALGHLLQQAQSDLHLLGAFLHRHHGGVRLVVDPADDRRDLAGARLRALRQPPNLLGDDGEAPPGLAGAGGFDRRIERQQVRLVGDLVDQREDAVDLADAFSERQ